MSGALPIALGLLAFAALSALIIVAWALYRRALAVRYAGDQTYDAIHFATTSDGWRLPLYRYAPQSPEASPARAQRPVLLVHGIATNHRNLDLDADRSLARWLAARGHDVWLLDLRGCGLARRRGPAAASTWGFDELAQRDLPAALAVVTSVTGAPDVDYVGYSMGGILGAALAGDPVTAARLRSVTCLGAPLRFDAAGLVPLVTRAGRFVARFGQVPMRWPARRNAWVGGRVGGPVARFILNPANIDPPVLRLALHEAIEDIPAGVLEQFHAWAVARSAPTSRDGAVDYTARLASARVPALFLAGTADRLAPPSAVAAGFRVHGGPSRFVLVGAGAADALHTLALDGDTAAVETPHAFGHADLILAREAPAVVFPALAAFLDGLAGSTSADGAAEEVAA